VLRLGAESSEFKFAAFGQMRVERNPVHRTAPSLEVFGNFCEVQLGRGWLRFVEDDVCLMNQRRVAVPL
jgi:hypothetical protein